MKYFTIPVFVPELACPNRCVFCNQNSISGCAEQPGMEETENIIRERLSTIPHENSHIEIGFFGGNFTGIEESLQRNYLAIAQKYLRNGQVQGIRLSTRPDYIDISSLQLLKEYGVTTIELGAQSLDDEVLKLAGRGHTVSDIEKAAALIKKHGLNLGLQMMTGLPGDTPDKTINTAKKIIELGADNTRIYPTLVIKGTKLADQYKNGLYQPQSINDAISITATLLEIFNEAGVKVIRVGLHPSEELADGDFIAGPYHPNFRQMAESEVWRRKLLKVNKGDTISIKVPKEELYAAIGHGGSNKAFLEQHFKKVVYLKDEGNRLPKALIIADKRIPLPAKNALRNLGQVVFLHDQFVVYKSISGHPDIFICASTDKVVVAPCIDQQTRTTFQSAGFSVIEGKVNPGNAYPASAIYNAVVTDKLLIHNLKITDKELLNTFSDREMINVKQGYTRCNLLALNDTTFITSDRGIQKVLELKGFEVLFVDPTPVLLKGQKHGFFPGCCGIFDNKIVLNGNLNFHPSGNEIDEFISAHGFKVISLYNGPLRDTGSIFFFKFKQFNNLAGEETLHNSTIFESSISVN